MWIDGRRCAVLAGAVFLYFVIFPADLAALLLPVEQVLRLTGLVSPWLYGLLAVALIAWAAVRVWGRRPSLAEPRVP